MNHSPLNQYNHNNFSFDNVSFFDKNVSNKSTHVEHPEFNMTQSVPVKKQRPKKSKCGYTINLDYAKAGLRGSFSDDYMRDDELIGMYFSNENVNRIQLQIKNEITLRTKGKYAVDVDQDIEDILIVMGHIMIEDGQFLLTKIVKQVKILNKRVVDFVVPDMISEITQNYGYQQEINKPLQQMMRPMNVNSAGRKTLPSVTSMWTH